MKPNGDFESADWEARGVKLDGRQTRPADDVGRPDRSSECSVIDGRGASDCIRRAAQAYKAGNQASAVGWLCAAIETIVTEPPTVQTLKSQSRKREIREGQRRRQAPHGETPQDAEA